MAQSRPGLGPCGRCGLQVRLQVRLQGAPRSSPPSPLGAGGPEVAGERGERGVQFSAEPQLWGQTAWI